MTFTVIVKCFIVSVTENKKVKVKKNIKKISALISSIIMFRKLRFRQKKSFLKKKQKKTTTCTPDSDY